MEWNRLMTPARLGGPASRGAGDDPFESDALRVTFSSAFRRLQDKMQVHGMHASDHARNRLTHSMEVSEVGRALGRAVEARLTWGPLRTAGIRPGDLGKVVAAACLAHDIGNCPFGHFGEQVIRHFFAEGAGAGLIDGLPEAARNDFLAFDGNPQGLRTVARLQGWNGDVGLGLTFPTLAAMVKYPRVAAAPGRDGVSASKVGLFSTELGLFEEIARTLGLPQAPEAPDGAGGGRAWLRHPLAFLVEAADDACYRIVDVEDGYNMKAITFDEAEELLIGCLDDGPGPEYRSIDSRSRQIACLRAKAIDRLVGMCAEVFAARHDQIMDGAFDRSIIKQTPMMGPLGLIERATRRKVFDGAETQKVLLVGERAVRELLEAFCEAFTGRERGRLSPRSDAVLKLFPEFDIAPKDRAGWLRAVVDYVSGMTDRYAVSLAATLRG